MTENFSEEFDVKIIRIRRINDMVYTYDWNMFMNWYDQHNTDMITDKPIDHLSKYIRFEKERMSFYQTLPPQTESSIIEMKNKLLFEFLREKNTPDLQEEEEKKEIDIRYRSMIDLETFSRNFFVFDCEESHEYLVSKPPGSWIIRRSSFSNPFSKSRNLITFTFFEKDTKHIKHKRVLQIQDVGWFGGVSKEILNFSLEQILKTNKEPCSTNLLELIEKIVIRPGKNKWADLLMSEKKKK